MKALVYGVAPEPFEVPEDANTLTVNLARTPTDLRQVPDPRLPHEDWVITRPRLTGICGSDWSTGSASTPSPTTSTWSPRAGWTCVRC
ncbi:MAG: hypothetical protein QOE30_4695 [Mycobacterium sp.]|nr:hypothetical protein [Mycobacterium sp.]